MLVFLLTMPRNNSWNNRWTGEGNIYARSRSRPKTIENNLDNQEFYYDFGDGWTAKVSTQKMSAKDANKIMKNSKGFCGYDWMIDSILTHGEIKIERPKSN